MEISGKDAELLAITAQLKVRGDVGRAVDVARQLTPSSHAAFIGVAIIKDKAFSNDTYTQIANSYKNWAKKSLDKRMRRRR